MNSTFKEFLNKSGNELEKKTRKKLNKKDKKGRPTAVHGWSGYGAPPNLSGAASNGGDGGGVGESYHGEREEFIPNFYKSKKYSFNWTKQTPYEEEAEESKKQQARSMYQNFRQQNMTKEEMVSRFQNQLGLTPQSATAYYERIAKEFGDTQQYQPAGRPGGMPGSAGAGVFGARGAAGAFPGAFPGATGMGEEPAEEPMEVQDWESMNRQGTIRRVENAHLVFKRQTDSGDFEELWVFKQGKDEKDAFEIRKDIIAGTDIPENKTISDDKKQKLESWSSGNIQMIYISGLPN